MIDKAKLGAITDSAHGYLDAIDKFYITEYADNIEFELNGIYMIENGKLGDYNINVNGNKPNSGRLLYENNELISGTLQFEDYVALIKKDKIKVKKGTFNLEILPKEEQENKKDGLYNSGYDEGRLLYRGYNPNNYIWLDENGDDKKQDEELYRIISYENDGTIKIVRKNTIGSYAWDTTIEISKNPFNNQNLDNNIIPRNNNYNSYCIYSGNYHGCNTWANQYNTYYQEKTLNELYSSFHYKWYSDNTYETLKPLNIDLNKTVTHDSSLNILLNDYWLSENNLSSYITTHSFDVGGIYSSSYNNIELEKKEQALYKWYGNVGLINVTDIIEASTNENCLGVDINRNKINNEWSCSKENNNWLQDSERSEYTISPYTLGGGSIWYVLKKGTFHYINTASSLSIRPVFFLRNDIVLSGIGTEENPYIIENF